MQQQLSDNMNILFIYNATQTYTNTVLEHINSFAHYAHNTNAFFCHQDQKKPFNVNLSYFDAVVLHYTIRLPFDQVADTTVEALASYSGLKVLFIQDEYDHTHRTWYWIKRLGIQLVFTVVPQENIGKVYPSNEFPGVRFVNNLTGYVPENIPNIDTVNSPSSRKIIVGYRGRSLPLRYGQLGKEKVGIGRQVKEYCVSNNIHHDIAWAENSRIYGPKWYEFMASCRAMLSSESGSNVFDWNGTLDAQIKEFRRSKRGVTDQEVYDKVIKPYEEHGLMNQISPRIFEAIAFRTALVLYEGDYSGIIKPDRHFISLKKDGSNLDKIFLLLQDGEYVDEITNRAYDEIILSGAYSYQAFVRMVHKELTQAIKSREIKEANWLLIENTTGHKRQPSELTTSPYVLVSRKFNLLVRIVYRILERLPMGPKILQSLKKGLRQ